MTYLLGVFTGVLIATAVPFFAFVLSTPVTAVRALARAERRFLRACGWRRRGQADDEWIVPPGYPYRVKYPGGYTRRHAVNAQVVAVSDTIARGDR